MEAVFLLRHLRSKFQYQTSGQVSRDNEKTIRTIIDVCAYMSQHVFREVNYYYLVSHWLKYIKLDHNDLSFISESSLWPMLKIPLVKSENMYIPIPIYFLKDFIYLFLDRGEGREKEKESNSNVWLPLMCPQLETWSTTLDWVSHQRPLGSQASTQATEPHQPGRFPYIFNQHFLWRHLLERVISPSQNDYS